MRLLRHLWALAVAGTIATISFTIAWGSSLQNVCFRVSSLAGLANPHGQFVELKDPPTVKTQCGGTCWIFSGVNFLETILTKQQGAPVHVSISGILQKLVLKRFVMDIQNEIDKPLLRGATTGQFFELIQGGVSKVASTDVPADYGAWKEAAKNWEMEQKNFINAYQAASSDAARQEVLNQANKYINAQIDVLVGQSFLSSSEVIVPAAQIHAASENLVYIFPPSKLNSEPKKNNTPAVTKPIAEPAISIPKKVLAESDLIDHITTQIDAGLGVVAAMNWAGKLVAYDGVLHVQVDLNIPKDDTDSTAISASVEHRNHGVLIVGYRKEGDQVIGLKIENTWGKKFGRSGYIVISTPDFLDSLIYICAKETPN